MNINVIEKEIDVDLKVQQAIEDKLKEQSATGGVGVLTGDKTE